MNNFDALEYLRQVTGTIYAVNTFPRSHYHGRITPQGVPTFTSNEILLAEELVRLRREFDAITHQGRRHQAARVAVWGAELNESVLYTRSTIVKRVEALLERLAAKLTPGNDPEKENANGAAAEANAAETAATGTD